MMENRFWGILLLWPKWTCLLVSQIWIISMSSRQSYTCCPNKSPSVFKLLSSSITYYSFRDGLATLKTIFNWKYVLNTMPNQFLIKLCSLLLQSILRLMLNLISLELDISEAWKQLLLDEDFKKYVVINTHRGLFHYNKEKYKITSCPREGGWYSKCS